MRTGQNDSRTHLQRVMLETGGGTSKCRLSLAARATEHVAKYDCFKEHSHCHSRLPRDHSGYELSNSFHGTSDTARMALQLCLEKSPRCAQGTTASTPAV
ncbi:hypothetical protein BKA82DRAFT_1001202, partial [Pisolithus tinctorius]